MAAPTIIAHAESAVLGSSDLTTYLNVASSQIGDIFLVYTLTDTAGVTGDAPVPEKMVNFDSNYDNHLDSYNGLSFYAMTDTEGGSNWDIECPVAYGTATAWVAGYVQLRNGVVAPNQNYNATLSNPATVDLNSVTNDSGVLVIISEGAGINTGLVNWVATDGYDPETGGTDYMREGVTSFYGFHAAYFPDIGPAGNYSYTLSGGTMAYAMVAFEVEGTSAPSSGGSISWIRA